MTGNKGVNIFVKNFVRGQKYSFSPKTEKEDYDIMVRGVKYEIKCNYRDNCKIIIEEWYDKGSKKRGWIVTSKSDYIVFVSRKTELMLIYPTSLLKRWYRSNHVYIKDTYDLISNKPSVGLYGDEWVSEFRAIPTNEIPIKPIVFQ